MLLVRSLQRVTVLVVIALGLLASACSGGTPGRVEWRDLTVALPDGWIVAEEETFALSLANATLEDVTERGEKLVYVQFTHEPDGSAAGWRQFVVDEQGTLEVDEAIEVDGIPATRLVFSFVTNDIPTREMVVVIPSRQLVGLFQPVATKGETDSPERFLAWRETFDGILASIDFGAPVPS